MTLDFTLTEASDNLNVTIQDTTTDWLAGEISSVYSVGYATLVPTILGVTYDPITVTQYFISGLQVNLSFVITADMLEIGGAPQYTSGDFVPDGDWSVQYTVMSDTSTDSVTISTLVYGTVEKGVLNQLRLQDLNQWSFDNTLYEALIKGAHYVYFKAILAADEEGDTTSLREALNNLEVMLINGTY